MLVPGPRNVPPTQEIQVKLESFLLNFYWKIHTREGESIAMLLKQTLNLLSPMNKNVLHPHRAAPISNCYCLLCCCFKAQSKQWLLTCVLIGRLYISSVGMHL